MRALDAARKMGQTLADKHQKPYVIWMVGWRTVLQPDGVEVPEGVIMEYVNPRQTEEQGA